jgi:hypothetical protein
MHAKRTLVCLCFVLLVSVAALGDTAVLLDDQNIEGTIERLDASGVKLKTSEGDRQIALGDMAELSLADARHAWTARGQMIVSTRSGDVLPALSVKMQKASVEMILLLGGKAQTLQMPLDRVKTIVFPGSDGTPADILDACRQQSFKADAQDLLAIRDDEGAWRKAQGALKSIEKEKISFTYHKQDRTIDRNRVVAIFLAAPAASQSLRPLCVLTTIGGGVFHLSDVKMDAQTAALTCLDGLEITLPRSDVASIRFPSDRVAALSDLKPASVRQHAMFDVNFPYRENRCAAGTPLRLGGRTHASGLGLHSFCELTYDLGGEYKTFVATAGIDDSARPMGDAILTILADDKELLKPTTLTGRISPMPIRLNVTGVRRLTIRADFGADGLDVGDLLDLVNARLMR